MTNPCVSRGNAPDPDSLGSRHNLRDPSLSQKESAPVHLQQTPISHRRRRHIRVGDSNRAGNVVGAIRSTRVPTQAPASEGGSIRYGDHLLFPLPLSHIHSLIHSSARWREIPLSNSETLRRLSEESGFEIPTRNVTSKQTEFAFSRA